MLRVSGWAPEARVHHRRDRQQRTLRASSMAVLYAHPGRIDRITAMADTAALRNAPAFTPDPPGRPPAELARHAARRAGDRRLG